MRTKEIKDPRLKRTYLQGLYDGDRSNPLNLSYDAIQRFNGLRDERSCTNQLFCYLFLSLNIFIVVINLLAVKKIDYSRLLYSQDFRTDFCGIKQLEKEKFVYWPDPVGWGPYVKTCVPNCPNSTNQEVCLYNQTNTEFVEDYCMKAYPTKRDRNYCIPDFEEKPEYKLIAEAQIRSWGNFLLYTAADLYILQRAIPGTLLGLTIIAYFSTAIMLIKSCQINKIWFFLTAIGGCVLNIYVGYLFYGEAKIIADKECQGNIGLDCARDRIVFTLICAGYFVVRGTYNLLLIGCKFPKIMENFQFFLYFGGAVRKFFVLWIPLFGAILQIVFITAFINMFTIIMTTGTNEDISAGRNAAYLTLAEFYEPIVRITIIKWYAYYSIFGFLLILYFYLSFFVTFMRCWTTSIVSQWYFCKTKDWLTGTFCKGFKTTLVHIGSIMYHGYYVTPLVPFRSFFSGLKAWFDSIEYSKTYQICAIKCCRFPILCYEKRCKYNFSKALYHMVVFGDQLSLAGIKVYFLKYRNWSRYKGLEGKFGIFSSYQDNLFGAIATYLAWCSMNKLTSDDLGQDLGKLNFPPLIMAIIHVAGLFTIRGFTHVIDYCLEVVVFCFIADEEMYQGDQRYAEDYITKIMNRYGEEAERDYLKNVEKQERLNPKKKKQGKKKIKVKNPKQGDLVFSDEEEDYSDEDDFDEEEGGVNKIDFTALINKGNQRKKEADMKADLMNKADQEDGQKKGRVKISEGGVAANLIKQINKQPVLTDGRDLRVTVKVKKDKDIEED